LFVDASGKVFAFGENEYGQLGNSDFSDSSSAVETLRGTSSFAAVSVAAGLGHTLIVDQDGSLWVSGMNRYYGQLGAGLDPATDSDQNTFINVPLEGDAIGVAAGFIHSVVLLENGDLLGAGFNGSRQLAISDTTPQDTFVKIASDVTDVWAGGYDTFFKKRDGTLWGTGYNRYGQLGTGTTGEYSDGAIPIVYASTNTPVRDVRQVAVGGGHVLFLLEDGRVYASGLNSSGQLGIGSTAPSAQMKYVTDGVEFFAAETIILPWSSAMVRCGCSGTTSSDSWAMARRRTYFTYAHHGTREQRVPGGNGVWPHDGDAA
jgi:alpha-tubulin suppressor-like RCC1 family protein